MYCSNCSTELIEDARYCSVCGASAARRRLPPRYAGFWRRVAAVCVDLALFYPAIVVFGNLLNVVPTPANRVDWGRTDSTQLYGSQLIQAQIQMMTHLGNFMAFVDFLLAPYYILMECSSMQGTLGKRLLGLQVTDLNGRRIRFWRSFGRYWARGLSAIPWQAGFIMAGFTAKKQALHDIIAGTLVVYARKGARVPDRYPEESIQAPAPGRRAST
jgi:uncharacterized RDD family membrane protein YckC